jgi:hypothetical protein
MSTQMIELEEVQMIEVGDEALESNSQLSASATPITNPWFPNC